MNRKSVIIVVLAVAVVALSALMLHPRDKSPRPSRYWAIGIYEGSSPFKMKPFKGCSNPVLIASDIKDINAKYAADPFLIHEGDEWFLFFEAMNNSRHLGELGVATSKDLKSWKYKQIVLREPFHLSYPYVFKWEGQYYMIPESRAAMAVRLYKASQFPVRWTYVKDLVKGNLVDSSIFRYQGKWWMFSGANPHDNDGLRLFYSDELTGPWKEHAKSPLVVHDKSKARPAGRVLCTDGKVYRFAQDSNPKYGSRVRAFEVTTLTPTDYAEHEIPSSPILKGSGKGWNQNRMHNIDAQQLSDGRWIASVDGYR